MRWSCQTSSPQASLSSGWASAFRRNVPWLTDPEREVLAGVACRMAIDEGKEPPFRLRPGLVAEIVRFYDTLRHNLKDVDAFERLALGALEPGAAHDRGAERLVRQTRFLVATFRHFEHLVERTGRDDEHALRSALIAEPAARPWRHVVLGVGDHAFDRHGLLTAHWDLLARVPGLERIDLVATDGVVAGAFHERIHQLLPGIEEAHVAPDAERPAPVLLVPPGGALTRRRRAIAKRKSRGLRAGFVMKCAPAVRCPRSAGSRWSSAGRFPMST